MNNITIVRNNMEDKDKDKLEKLTKLQKIIGEETNAYRIATDIIQKQANL